MTSQWSTVQCVVGQLQSRRRTIVDSEFTGASSEMGLPKKLMNLGYNNRAPRAWVRSSLTSPPGPVHLPVTDSVPRVAWLSPVPGARWVLFPWSRGSAQLLLLKSLCRVLGLQTFPTLCRSEALLLSVLVAACLALSTPGCMEGRHLTALLSGWAACRTCAGGHRVLVDSQGVPSDVAVTWPHVTS